MKKILLLTFFLFINYIHAAEYVDDINITNEEINIGQMEVIFREIDDFNHDNYYSFYTNKEHVILKINVESHQLFISNNNVGSNIFKQYCILLETVFNNNNQIIKAKGLDHFALSSFILHSASVGAITMDYPSSDDYVDQGVDSLPEEFGSNVDSLPEEIGRNLDVDIKSKLNMLYFGFDIYKNGKDCVIGIKQKQDTLTNVSETIDAGSDGYFNESGDAYEDYISEILGE